MGKHTFFVALALTLVWFILVEEISWMSYAIGLTISILSLHIGSKFLPFKEIANVNFFALIVYPFWLLRRIYVDGLYLMKFILTGTNTQVGVVTVQTRLSNEHLRIIAANSITLTPGSVFLKLEDENITLLWVGDEASVVEEMRRIEDKLLKAERQG